MTIMRIGVLACLAFVLLCSGCRRRDPVVAKVGPLVITQSEFTRKLADVPQNFQSYVLTPNGRRQFLDILIREKMIVAAAAASEVRKSAEFKSQAQHLREEEEERLKEGREVLLTRMWRDDLRARGVIKASEDEARDYLRKHPTEVDIRHILLANPGEAQALAKRARSGGNFAQMAKKNSLEAGSAADGGRMPSALYGEVIPELQDIVFRMRIGEISGPIKSKFGYYVLKKDAERNIPFGQAEERILDIIEHQKLDHYLQSIQEKFPVEVVDEQFK
ncbi:MAG: peptidylprolyl isomerase [Elusimicrobia bacterium]|nr:peptidylprolyl isomerase [Elusimicrobiota bacterium]